MFHKTSLLNILNCEEEEDEGYIVLEISIQGQSTESDMMQYPGVKGVKGPARELNTGGLVVLGLEPPQPPDH